MVFRNPETVVVTGASAGVGRAAAAAFGALGCNVALLARGADGLAGARRDVEAAGGRGLVFQADVADSAAVEAAAEAAEREFGPIDAWINVAMATVYAPLSALTAEEFRRVTEVTYLGQVYGTMAALSRMRPRDRGTVVNVGSALGYQGLPLQSAYCGAKFAIRGFTEAVRGELMHEGSRVRLSLVILPAVNTPQFDWARNKLDARVRPVPPVYQPEVAAAAIVRAAREAPRELCVAGSSLQLMAGSMLAPALLERMLARKGYEGQTADEPAEERPDNLFAPLAGDFGAHGRFDDEARSHAVTTAGSTLRGAAVLVPLVGGLLGFALARRKGR